MTTNAPLPMVVPSPDLLAPRPAMGSSIQAPGPEHAPKPVITDPGRVFPDDSRSPNDGHVPAWWWAPGSALPYRMQNVVPPASATVALPPIDGAPAFGEAFAQRVMQDIQGWLDRPLVWEDDGTTVRAVLMGLVRFTWSRGCPSGVFEHFERSEGWVRTVGDLPMAITNTALVPLLSGGGYIPGTAGHALVVRMVSAVVQHNARIEQRLALGTVGKRLTVWRLPTTEGTFQESWCPFLPNGHDPRLVTMLPAVLKNEWVRTSSIAVADAVARSVLARIRSNARAMLRALAGHSPLWAAIRRLSTCPGSMVHTGGWPWIRQLFESMPEWEQRLVEHPHAGLWLAPSQERNLRPNVHLWREDVWVPSALRSPQVWRFALRNAPMASLRQALHHGGIDGGWFRDSMHLDTINVMGSLPGALRPVPSIAWRSVPAEVWRSAARVAGYEVGLDHQDEELARGAWHHRALAVFVHAVQHRPWAAQQVSLPTWIAACRPVWEWVAVQPRCPFADPSWTWASLMDAASAGDGTHAPEWRSLLRHGPYGKAMITPVNSLAHWETLGILMQNCLKDSRSDHYRDAVRQQKAFLYRLDLNGRRSTVVIGQDDDRDWAVIEHRGMANTPPPVDHVQLATTLAGFHDAHETRSGWWSRLHRAAQRRWQALIHAEVPGESDGQEAVDDVAQDPGLLALHDAAWRIRLVSRPWWKPGSWWAGWLDMWTDVANEPWTIKVQAMVIFGAILGAIVGVLVFALGAWLLWV